LSSSSGRPDGASAASLEATVVSASSEAAPPLAPPVVPGYQLEALVGRGGMGEVWRARQLSLDREVAVKLLPEKCARDAEFVARFEKETKALAALSHPNIVQIIDRGKAGEQYYFAMELVAGVNLRERMRRELSVRDALRIGVEIARAIDCAHEKRIVHRDLKPENVLVDARGHVKVADFGLAGMHGGEAEVALTATAVAMGTLNYMAPEQRRDAKHVDHRADLYSLGVLLYEMLTGELPLGRFKLPSKKREGVDPAVDELVAQLLEPEASGRPARALDVAAALEALLPPASGDSAPRPISSGGAGPAVVAVAAPRSGGWRLGLTVLGVLVLAAVVLKVSSRPSAAVLPEAPTWYEDSEDELLSSVVFDQGELSLDFEAGSPDAGEEINTHAGAWTLKGGRLEAVQFGDATEADRLVPRAYLAHRYFSVDDFEASVEVELEALPAEFPTVEPEKAPQLAELAFRIKDLQVSVFAVPGAGMRLGWRYFTRDGQEHSGTSTKEQVDELLEDSVRVPHGAFTLRVRLRKLKSGDVNAEAFVNERRFARKVLPGLAGQAGKVALGCRNAVCRFDNLKVSGQAVERPRRQRP
jgi:serine/threonine-protein kinase